MRSKYSDSQRKERRKAKHLRKKTRAYQRRGKHMEQYRANLENRKYRGGHWRDSNSRTGYSQYCDYQPIGCNGSCTCEYPCNGDC